MVKEFYYIPSFLHDNIKKYTLNKDKKNRWIQSLVEYCDML